MYIFIKGHLNTFYALDKPNISNSLEDIGGTRVALELLSLPFFILGMDWLTALRQG